MLCQCFYTPTHALMVEQYLAPTAFAAGLDLQRCYDRTEIGHEWDSPGMIEFGLRNQCKLCYETVPTDELKMFCGADHIFFGDFQQYIVEFMRGYDIAFSDDAGMYCQDFCVYRDTVQVRAFFANKAWATFEAAASITEPYAKKLQWINDQEMMTHLLSQGCNGLRLGKIPAFVVANWPACGGVGKVWEPGMEFIVPPAALAFHANWTVGVPNKMAMLEYVRRQRQ